MNELRNALDNVLAHAAQIREAQATHAAYERLDRFMADVTSAWERLTSENEDMDAEYEKFVRRRRESWNYPDRLWPPPLESESE